MGEEKCWATTMRGEKTRKEIDVGEAEMNGEGGGVRGGRRDGGVRWRREERLSSALAESKNGWLRYAK